MNRKERRANLQEMLDKDPFLTDQQLAEKFAVSVATIRLDRMALNIPELRERAKNIASDTYSRLKALEGDELIGDLIDIELGKQGISILVATENMVFSRTKIMRGHFLFAQGNSLAVAVVNSDVALTHTADICFHHPVKLGERVVAKAIVAATSNNSSTIQVESRVGERLVFSGEYVVVDVGQKGGSHD